MALMESVVGSDRRIGTALLDLLLNLDIGRT